MAQSTLLSSWSTKLRPIIVRFQPFKVGNFHHRNGTSCRPYIVPAAANSPVINRASFRTAPVESQIMNGQVLSSSWSQQIPTTQNPGNRISFRTFCSERSGAQSVKSSDVSDRNVGSSTNDDARPTADIDTVLSHLDKAQDGDVPGLKNLDKLKLVIGLFLDYGANKESLTEFLLAHSNIVARDQEQLESAVKFLADYGFNISATFKILAVVSDVFEPQNRKSIICVLNLLRGYRMEDKDIIKVASVAPEIMNIKNKKTLTNQIDQLGEMFNHDDLVNVIIKWPEILLADPEQIRLKFEYIMDTMNMKYTQLVRSNALSHPFQHIKARHLFLFRAGLFETPDKNKQTKHIKNPSLLAMMDCSDEKFASKLGAGMTVSDYQTFCEVLILEDELAEEEEVDDVDSGIDGYKRSR